MLIFRNYLFFAIFSILFLGCGSGGGVDKVLDSGKETTIQRVNLTLKIGYDESILSRETESVRETKRVKFSDLSSVLITIFDSQKNYYVDQNIFKNSSGNWEFQLNDIPTGINITFIAEGFDSRGYRIFSGKVIDELDISDSSIVIPLSLAQTEATVLTPSIASIIGNSGSSQGKQITFTITNPNSEFVNWKLTPDEALKKYGTFSQTNGSLDFRFKSELTFDVNFSGTLDNIIFENRLDLNNSVGDLTTIFFKLYEQNNKISFSIAPVVNNISLVFKSDRVIATALLDSSLMKKEVCTNDFKDLILDFNMTNRSFIELFTRYYNAIDKYNELNESITNFKNQVSDNNFTKLLNLDISYSFDSLFLNYQKQYGYSSDSFNNLYKLLKDNNFSKLLNYYQSDLRGENLTLLETYYRDDMNFSNILKNYISNFGRENFSNLIEYYIADSQSTLLTDYNFSDKNFSKNGEFFYGKFGVKNLDDNESNESKANFDMLLKRFTNNNYTSFYTVFTTGGKTLNELLGTYYNDSYSFDNNFAPLLNLVIDENFDKLWDNLNYKYSNLSSFKTLAEFINNSDFIQWLNYYKYQTSELLNSIRSKLDHDICSSEELDTLNYQWSLDKNSLLIEDPYKNPITIKNFTGTLQDKLNLIVSSANGVKSEYSYQINIKSWLYSSGNPIKIDNGLDNNSTDNNSTENNNSNGNTDNNSSTGGGTTNPTVNYKFSLDSNVSGDLLLLYGESTEVVFTTSKYFSDFMADIVGDFGNGEIFTLGEIKDISTATTRKYSVKITANRTLGGGYFTFAIQNSGHAEAKTIKIAVENPIQVLELKRNYTVVEGTEVNLTMRVSNARGDTLNFSISESSSNFDAVPIGTINFTSGTTDGIGFDFKVSGLKEGESNLTIRITDTTMEPDYWLEYPIVIKVDKTNEQVLTNKLLQFACGSVQLDSKTYEYVADGWSPTADSSINSPDNYINVQSFNQLDSANLSRIVILYPKPSGNFSGEYTNFYVYNQSTFKNIGTIKYGSSMKDKEFYIKYYDISTNSVMCEKHKF